LIPTLPNLVRTGVRPYDELPAYLGSWDVGIMPFAHNDATRYISPTKTPEYLAAGLPVASTSQRDVVIPYGAAGLVEIGDEPAGFVAAAERALLLDRARHRAHADAFLRDDSWDATWAAMDAELERATARRSPVVRIPLPAWVEGVPDGRSTAVLERAVVAGGTRTSVDR
jgi:glycosyltransferase involved in cell wall biosynthesis